MDMRQEFSRVLAEYGHYILVVHNNKRIRCSCWNHITQEANKTCKYCFGLGYTPVAEKHLCREKSLTQNETMAQTVRSYDYGDNMTPSKCFYLEHNVSVEAKDMIINCQFDRKNIPLLSDYYIYEVSYVERYRGEHGRIEYTKVYCSLDTVNMKIIAANIRKTGNRDIYSLGMRRTTNE